MCAIEAIVNSRPITKVSDDPRDIQPLTPNIFLLPRNDPQLPPGAITSDEITESQKMAPSSASVGHLLGEMDAGIPSAVTTTTEVVSQEKKLRSW